MTVDPSAPGGFTTPSERWLKPAQDCPTYPGKVAVLTGPYVMSSAEAFLLMMKQIPNAELIGAPSYGASGNPKPHDLGNGVTVYLPSWKALRLDGTTFEVTGIQPDIPVATRAQDFRTEDPILKAAIERLRQ